MLANVMPLNDAKIFNIYAFTIALVISTKRFFNFAFSISMPFQKPIYATNPTQRVLAAGYDSIVQDMINITVEIAV